MLVSFQTPPPPSCHNGPHFWELASEFQKLLVSKRTTHHPTKDLPHRVAPFGGVVCELSEPKRKEKVRTTPSFALAMLIVDFVGVVRRFRGLKKLLVSKRK